MDFNGMMEKLTQKNLLIICVDEKNGIYRYHNILSEYLTQQFSLLAGEQQKKLLAKSVPAFEKRGDPQEAMRELCQAGDFENMMRVARTMGGSTESWGYLDRVPPNLLILDASLAAQCFMYNLGLLNIERCRVLYDEFKEHYEGTDIFRMIQFGEVYVTKGTSILPEFHALTAEQINAFGFGPVVKAMNSVQNSEALIERMQYEGTEICIDKADETCAGINSFVQSYITGEKAQLYEELGRLNESLGCYFKAMGSWESSPMPVRN